MADLAFHPTTDQPDIPAICDSCTTGRHKICDAAKGIFFTTAATVKTQPHRMTFCQCHKASHSQPALAGVST